VLGINAFSDQLIDTENVVGTRFLFAVP